MANIAPDYRLLAIDESQYFDKEQLKELEIDKVITVYAYNRNLHVYCCELRPSYELYEVESVAITKKSMDDELYDKIQEVINGPLYELYSYMHCSIVYKNTNQSESNIESCQEFDDLEDWAADCRSNGEIDDLAYEKFS
jgi:hypothetical protein